MEFNEIKAYIERVAQAGSATPPRDFYDMYEHFLSGLEDGSIRSAEPVDSGWQVNSWVKQGILLGFKYGKVEPMGTDGSLKFFDKHTYPTQYVNGPQRNIRIVPGGSSVRRGAFVGNNVTMMPPMYINAGAYVGEGSMIDSHALVGSCAQVGQGVHLSASAQLGGVLEPVGALPVIVEDGALIGGNTGIYEGTTIKKGAVIGAGVILTKSTPVYDIVHERILKGSDEAPLVIPENAVVVPGSRAINGNDWAAETGLSLQCPIIIKYKDEKTASATALESLLR